MSNSLHQECSCNVNNLHTTVWFQINNNNNNNPAPVLKNDRHKILWEL